MASPLYWSGPGQLNDTKLPDKVYIIINLTCPLTKVSKKEKEKENCASVPEWISSLGQAISGSLGQGVQGDSNGKQNDAIDVAQATMQASMTRERLDMFLCFRQRLIFRLR